MSSFMVPTGTFSRYGRRMTDCSALADIDILVVVVVVVGGGVVGGGGGGGILFS
jgi:hypothetical protein